MFGHVWEIVKVGVCMLCVHMYVHVNLCSSTCAHVPKRVCSVSLCGCLGVLKVCAHIHRWMCMSTWVDMSSRASFCPAKGQGGGRGQSAFRVPPTSRGVRRDCTLYPDF